MTKQDAYKLVTDRIIEALESGVVPWHKPWRSFSGNAPRSMSTGKAYQGVNVWTLGATAMMRGYSSPYWITFKQAKERGGSVRKGEKGTPVVFWKFIEKTDASGDVTDRIPLLRYFTVFNVEQCDGIEAPAIEALPERDPIEACEAIAAGYIDGPTVNHGGDRAYYSPALDMIGMPRIGQFDTSEHYYGTLFHELAHSTGHADRLARKSLVHPAPFGSEDYSREELIAEMAAAFLCGEAGIEVNIVHHASYIGSWLKALQDDPRLVVQAGAAAQKAAARILGDTFADQEGDADQASPDPRSITHEEESRWTLTLAPGNSTPTTTRFTRAMRSPCASSFGTPTARATARASFATASRSSREAPNTRASPSRLRGKTSTPRRCTRSTRRAPSPRSWVSSPTTARARARARSKAFPSGKTRPSRVTPMR